MAGTGFRIDIARLPYLPEALRAGIATSRAGAAARAGRHRIIWKMMSSCGSSGKQAAGSDGSVTVGKRHQRQVAEPTAGSGSGTG